MLTDDGIKTVIQALEDEFNKHKREYETVLRQIREICPHNDIDDEPRLCGYKCRICGQYFQQKPKKQEITCDGCQYQFDNTHSTDCIACSRMYSDFYKIKK